VGKYLKVHKLTVTYLLPHTIQFSSVYLLVSQGQIKLSQYGD